MSGHKSVWVMSTTDAKVLSKTSQRPSNGGKWRQSKAIKLLSDLQKNARAKHTKTAEPKNPFQFFNKRDGCQREN